MSRPYQGTLLCKNIHAKEAMSGSGMFSGRKLEPGLASQINISRYLGNLIRVSLLSVFLHILFKETDTVLQETWTGFCSRPCKGIYRWLNPNSVCKVKPVEQLKITASKSRFSAFFRTQWMQQHEFIYESLCGCFVLQKWNPVTVI